MKTSKQIGAGLSGYFQTGITHAGTIGAIFVHMLDARPAETVRPFDLREWARERRAANDREIQEARDRGDA